MKYFSRDEVENIGRAGGRIYPDESNCYRFLSAFWLYCEPEDIAFTPHAPSGFWEAWVTAWMSQQFEHHELFIDVGANVGYYTMLASNAGLDVMSFEPNEKLNEMLIHSCEKNRFRNWCHHYSTALSNVNGTTRLYIPEGHSGGASIGDVGVEVQTATLDSFPIRQPSVLIKIDAEGAEPLIIEGMDKLLVDKKVTVVLEWQAQRWQEPEKFARVLEEISGTLHKVNYHGEEEVVTVDYLTNTKELEMVIIRATP